MLTFCKLALVTTNSSISLRTIPYPTIQHNYVEKAGVICLLSGSMSRQSMLCHGRKTTLAIMAMLVVAISCQEERADISRNHHATCSHADGSCEDAAHGSELVSVVTPTRGKTQKWHELLYKCFMHQTYQPR